VFMHPTRPIVGQEPMVDAVAPECVASAHP
jgi:hypothetical protein